MAAFNWKRVVVADATMRRCRVSRICFNRMHAMKRFSNFRKPFAPPVIVAALTRARNEAFSEFLVNKMRINKGN